MLKPIFLQATNLNDAWFQLVSMVQEEGRVYTITKGSYEGSRRWEFDFVTVQITFPGARPLVPDMPPGLSIPPPTSMEYIEGEYLPYLVTGKVKEYESYTYGNRLVGLSPEEAPKYHDQVERYRKLNKVNQVKIVTDMLRAAGDGTNQATMEIGMPSDCGTIDPPCLRLIDCRIQDGALHFYPYFRSWDLWGGFPANLAALQLLKETMASDIGVNDGEIIATSKGLHLYDFSWELAKLRTNKGGETSNAETNGKGETQSVL